MKSAPSTESNQASPPATPRLTNAQIAYRLRQWIQHALGTKGWPKRSMDGDLLAAAEALEARLSERATPTYGELSGAVARGWCAHETQHYVMDATLANAITREVLLLLNKNAAPQGTPEYDQQAGKDAPEAPAESASLCVVGEKKP